MATRQAVKVMGVVRGNRAALAVLAAMLLVAASCGGADDPSESAEPASAVAPADAPDTASDDATNEADGEASEPVANETTETSEAPAQGDAGGGDAPAAEEESSGTGDAPAPIDPLTLDPGTAVFVAEGREYRFALGDSIFDICEFNADFGLGQAKLDLVDGPTDGSPHLQVLHGADKTVVVMAFPPDTAYIAGKGEETDPYFFNFDVVPPTITTLTSGDGVSSGVITVANVISGEEVQASVAVRCS